MNTRISGIIGADKRVAPAVLVTPRSLTLEGLSPMRNHSIPTTTEYSEEFVERFRSRIGQSSTEAGCCEWQGQLHPKGYGVIKFRQRPLKAHRVAYELAFGPIPDGHVIHHECENRSCVNPDHLTAMSPSDHSRLREGRNYPRQLTHCKRGHEFGEPNVYTWRGMRRCRICDRMKKREMRNDHVATS